MNKNIITAPILNILAGEKNYKKYSSVFKKQTNEQSFIYRLKSSSSKELHKRKLGKQNYCLNIFGCRNWIWEGDNWRVYVSKEGFDFEVDQSLSIKDAMIAWQDYFEKMTNNEIGSKIWNDYFIIDAL